MRPEDYDLDVLIVGAGLSGIGAAYRIRQRLPKLRLLVLEARDGIGGTWDLFRYPGVRSDSDIYTFGYPFRPWAKDTLFATGAEMRDYIRCTARAGGIEELIRFGQRAAAAAWSSETASWTVEVCTAGGPVRYRCSFLYVCTGYFSYAHGYRPRFPGLEEYRGRLVSPQFWPEDLDCAGRDVVIIGSGSTAVTLAPALAAAGGRVTVLQRSPGYVAALPSADPVADALRRWLPTRIAHRVLRIRAVALGSLLWWFCRRFPGRAAALLRGRIAARLGWDVVERHFTPAYRPWDQRLCVAPDGDLFTAIQNGTVRMVTDRIDRFVPHGVRLESGRELAADVVVSATGLSLEAAGGMSITVDGRPVHTGDLVTYRGVMFDGVPNLAYPLGYANASWTLRSDLAARWVCRFLRHLHRHGLASGTPTMPSAQPRRPWLALTSGYLRRSAHLIPQQGSRSPWRVGTNYFREALEFALTPVGWDIRIAAHRPGQRLLGQRGEAIRFADQVGRARLGPAAARDRHPTYSE